MPRNEGVCCYIRGRVNFNSIARWLTDVSEGGVSRLRQELTLVLCRPRSESAKLGTGIRLRCQVQHRSGWSEADVFRGLWNSGPFVAALRPLLKLFFSDKFAQDRSHASRMGRVASGNQSFDHVGRCGITVFCPEKVDNGISLSLVFGNRLPQKSLKNGDGLPKPCALALQCADHFIERFQLLRCAVKRGLISIFQ